MIDLEAAQRFVQLNARLIDRRRFAFLVDGAPAERVVVAVHAYANPDGGFAGVIEPDTRTTRSQPIGVLTAFGVLHEVGAPASADALDWLASISGADGGIPFSLPSVDDAPHAPWMGPSDGSSLLMTAGVTAAALRLGAQHEWIDAASAFCRRRIDGADPLSAYETKHAIDFLDAAGDVERLERFRERIPEDGRLPVQGGTEDEALTVLDLAPRPGTHARRLVNDELVASELNALEARQRDDGSWDFDWLAWSPTSAVEWRARLTVDAVATLKAEGRLA